MWHGISFQLGPNACRTLLPLGHRVLCSMQGLPLRLSRHQLSTEIYDQSLDSDLDQYEQNILERFPVLKFTATLPKKTKVVICGSGMVGTSLLYYLSILGWAKDVVLLDRGSIGGFTTWRGSGFLGSVKINRAEMNILQTSRHLVQSLSDEGHDIGWNQCGSLHLARTRDRLTFLRKMNAIAEARGTESSMLTPEEISKKCDMLNTSDVLGGFYVPSDGVCDPYRTSYTLLKICIERGAQVLGECPISRIIVRDRRVVAIETNQGLIECDYFVNAGGLWAREIGKLSDPVVRVPIHPAEHYYLHTYPMDGVDPAMPAIRDPDGNIYLREYEGGFLAGGFEKWAKPTFEKGDLPEEMHGREQHADWDHFHVLLKEMLHRLPLMRRATLKKLYNTSVGFSPDTKWIMGLVPELTNYFVGAGLKSGGSNAAGGIGYFLAHWIMNGDPPMDTYDHSILRFLPAHNNRKFMRDRVREVPGLHFRIPYPFADFETSRGLRMSPLFPRLKEAGAAFGQVMGYERPSYFEPKSADGNPEPFRKAYTNTWTKPHWFEVVKDEYRACRERCAILDYSSFTKFDIWSKGDEVVNWMQYLCSNDIDIPLGGIAHTGLQNRYGGYENDCSMARIAPNHYMMIAPSIQQARCGAWLRHNLPTDGSVVISDITSMYTAICLMGPLAPKVLAELSDTDLSTKAFPFFSFKEIDVGLANGIRAMNLTHTGELGWVLYIPNEYALHVYDNLRVTGEKYGMMHAGYYAMRSLRIEKFYAFWGQDIDSTTTPLECGRAFRVKLSKDIDFIGRRALERQQREGVKRLYVQLVLQDHDINVDPWAWGGEPILRNGKLTGITTTTQFGYTLDNLVCLGFVRNYDSNGNMAVVTPDYIIDGSYEVDIAGVRYAAAVSLRSPTLPTKFPEPQSGRYLATQ